MVAPLPPWRQLEARLRAEIAGMEPGDRLPSLHQLAEREQVSVATIQKSLRPLKDEGLVVGSPGYAMFVAEPPADVSTNTSGPSRRVGDRKPGSGRDG